MRKKWTVCLTLAVPFVQCKMVVSTHGFLFCVMLMAVEPYDMISINAFKWDSRLLHYILPANRLLHHHYYTCIIIFIKIFINVLIETDANDGILHYWPIWDRYHLSPVSLFTHSFGDGFSWIASQAREMEKKKMPIQIYFLRKFFNKFLVFNFVCYRNKT